MTLSLQQQQIVRDALSSHNTTCSVCGLPHFVIIDKLYELREFNDGNLIVGGDSSILPLVIISCMNCGNLITMSAIKLGLLNTQEKVVHDNEADD